MDLDLHLSRRNLVLGLAGAGAAGAVAAASAGGLLAGVVGAVAGTAAPAPPRPVPLARGSYDDWLRAVGRTFGATGGYRLKLVGIRAVGSAANRRGVPGVRSRAFVALFNVLGRATMAGDLVYSLAHGRDRFDLYLGAGAARQRMIAVLG
jgi:hypothetical protein